MSTSLHDAVEHHLARRYDHVPQQLKTCLPPLLHEIDPRDLKVGDVFLWDGAEHTVQSTHKEPIRCALGVDTDKASLYFDKFSDHVTVVL